MSPKSTRAARGAWQHPSQSSPPPFSRWRCQRPHAPLRNTPRSLISPLASPAFCRRSFLARFWLWFNTTSRQLIPPQSTQDGHGYRTACAQPFTCTHWGCKPPAPHRSWQSEDSILHPPAGEMHLDSHEFNLWILAQRVPPACRHSRWFY